MFPCDFNPNDPLMVAKVDALLDSNKGKDVRLDTDIITCAVEPPEVIGVAVGRPVLYIHEFIVAGEILQRYTAELLLGYSLAKASSLGERRLHFLINRDNIKMQQFIEAHGAWQQHDGMVYTMMVPEVIYGRPQPQQIKR